MRSYPSTVKEIRFRTCIQKDFRFPPFFVYLGALLYWFFGRGFTQAPRYIRPSKMEQCEAVINTENSSGGVEYSDAYLLR
jgi:glycerol-3-phosphate dehydrogenase